MAVVAFLSAKGAPGTTTTALLCAALWPRRVLLVDADPQGGDVALRLPRADGLPVDRDRGLLSLLPLARRELLPSALSEHAQTLAGGTEVLAGLTGPQQACAAGQLWQHLAHAFTRTTDRDVLVDCGRVAPGDVHLPVVARADTEVWVVRPTVSGVVHARERIAALRPMLVSPDGRPPRVGVVLVVGPGGERDASGVSRLIERDLPGVELFGVLANDPDGAAVFDGAPVARPERTLLVRSARPIVARIAATVGATAQQPSAAATSVPGQVEEPAGRSRLAGRRSRTPQEQP